MLAAMNSPKITTTTLLLAAAGTAWAVGQAVLPDLGSTTAERYENVAAARDMEVLSAALFFTAAILLVLGALSLARLVPAGRGRRPMAVGVRLLALGGIWLAAGRGAFNLEFLALTGPDVPQNVALGLLEESGGLAFVPLVLTLPCLLLGPVLIGIGVIRAGGRWWGLALWVVGIGTFVATEFAVKPAEIVGIALAGAGLAVLGSADVRPIQPIAPSDSVDLGANRGGGFRN